MCCCWLMETGQKDKYFLSQALEWITLWLSSEDMPDPACHSQARSNGTRYLYLYQLSLSLSLTLSLSITRRQAHTRTQRVRAPLLFFYLTVSYSFFLFLPKPLTPTLFHSRTHAHARTHFLHHSLFVQVFVRAGQRMSDRHDSPHHHHQHHHHYRLLLSLSAMAKWTPVWKIARVGRWHGSGIGSNKIP